MTLHRRLCVVPRRRRSGGLESQSFTGNARS